MRTFLRSKVTLLFMSLGLLLAMAGVAYASSVDVAVVDVDVAPANSADLKPGGDANLKYTLTVSGSQAGTATFEIYKDWELKNGAFTGSNPEEFTIGPRAGGDPATVITRTGTLHVDSTQPDVLGKTLTVGVFDITNTNTSGGKLAAGTSGTYTVNVDGTKPTITLTSPEDGKTYAVGSSLTASFTCADAGGTGIATTNGCVGTQANGTTISTATAGPRTFTVTATDKAGNTETVTHNYSVANPNTAPLVSVSGVTNGNSYEFGSVPSATCDVKDTEDGDSSFAATLSSITGSLSSYGLGSQTASCSYTDQGGLTRTASATYSIVDTTKPVIVYKNATTNPNTNNWYNADVTANFEATDDVGLASGTTGLDSTGKKANFSQTTTGQGASVNVSSGTVTDVAGNEAIAVNSANYKIDQTAPSVAYKAGSATPAANAAGWNNTNVTVTFEATDTLSGMGATDADQKATGTATTSGEGTNVNVGSPAFTDRAGNPAAAGTATSPNFNIDLSDPYNVAFVGGPAAGSSPYFGSVPAAPTCSADDDVSGLKDCVVTGYSNAVGPHTMTATATDNAGRTKTETRSYTVLGWNLSNFKAPVDMGMKNNAKAGSTVPLKFNVFAGTTELTSTSVVQTFIQKESCIAGTGDDIEQYATGGTSLRYSGTPGVDGQFVFNWQTPKAAGSCYRVTVTTQDGSTIYSDFQLR